MRLPGRDIVATLAVAVALVAYLLSANDTTVSGLDGVRAPTLVVLASGFAASAVATTCC